MGEAFKREKRISERIEEIQQKRILIADTDVQRYKDLISILEKNNIKILIVSSRTELVQEATDFLPDIIFMNLLLGRSTTIPLIKLLQPLKNKLGMEILVYTKHHSKSNLIECIKAGASDFIVEPAHLMISPDATYSRLVLQRIKYFLRKRQTLTEAELFNDESKDSQSIEMIHDAVSFLADSSSSHTGLQSSLRYLAESTGATRANLYLGNVNLQQGLVVASSDDEKLQNFKVNLDKYPELREVMIKNVVLQAPNISHNPLTKDIKSNIKSIEVNSMLVFPVKHRGSVVGAMSLKFARPEFGQAGRYMKTLFILAQVFAPKASAIALLNR